MADMLFMHAIEVFVCAHGFQVGHVRHQSIIRYSEQPAR